MPAGERQRDFGPSVADGPTAITIYLQNGLSVESAIANSVYFLFIAWTSFEEVWETAIDVERIKSIQQGITNWNRATASSRSNANKRADHFKQLLYTAPIPAMMLAVAFAISRYS